MGLSASFLSRLRDHGVRKFLAALTFFAFFTHALIPVGYMPDTKALERGLVKIVLCTAQGTGSITLDQDGKQHAPSTKGQLGFCAFGVAPTGTVPAFAALVIPAVLFVASASIGIKTLILERLSPDISQPRAPPAI